MGAALLSATAASGCVIEGGSGPTATELYRLIDAHCTSATRCGCGWAVTDEDACTTELEARWKARLTEGLNKGLQYDAACFTAMTEQIERYGCAGASGEIPLCESFCAPLHGDVAEGEPCGADQHDDGLVSDCAQGLYCLDGTCTAPCVALSGRGEGEPCLNELVGPYDDCAEGLFCSWSSGQCERAPGQDEPCPDGYCDVGLYCDWQFGTCRRQAGVGEPCFEAECAEDLWCQYELNQCTPRATEGQSCDAVPCIDALYCTYDGILGSSCRRPAAEGESCQNVPCEGELWCNESSVCVAPPAEGQACLLGFVCAEGLVCDPVQLLCVAPPGEGEPCPAGECADGTWCDNSVMPEGVCTARRAIDEECSGHRQCESGYCPNGFCWPLPLEGDDCTGAGVCAGGLVCNGTTCEPTVSQGPAACSYLGW